MSLIRDITNSGVKDVLHITDQLLVSGISTFDSIQTSTITSTARATLDEIVVRNITVTGTVIGSDDPAFAGSQGDPGTNGTNGSNGSDGTNGTDGTNGINGTNGTNGIDGTNGTNGIDGTNGTVNMNNPSFTGQMKINTVPIDTYIKNLSEPAFIQIYPKSGFIRVNGSPPMFKKDEYMEVCFTGQIIREPGGYTALYLLPDNYKPLYSQIFVVASTDGSNAYGTADILVYSNGLLVVRRTDYDTISLNNIRYQATN